LASEPEEVAVEGETENPYANVVTFGRKSHGEVVPYLPPEPSPRDEIIAKKRDDDAAELLQMVLERIDSGELHGLALVAGQFDDNGNLKDVVTIVSEVAGAYPLGFTGAVEDLKLTLIEMRQCSEGEGCAPREPEVIELYGDFDD
jgi:hypothetical protein